MLFYHLLSPLYIPTSCKDESSMQVFTVVACHPGYVLEGEYCVCDQSDPDIFRCDGSNRYFYIRVGQQQQPCTLSTWVKCHCWNIIYTISKPAYNRLNVLDCAMYAKMQEGFYAWVSELESSKELTHVSGAPPSFLHCSRQGRLPGCLFMFDQMQVDQQCADGRTGKHCSYYCCYKLLSQTYVVY